MTAAVLLNQEFPGFLNENTGGWWVDRILCYRRRLRCEGTCVASSTSGLGPPATLLQMMSDLAEIK